MGYEIPDYMQACFQEGLQAEQMASFSKQEREERAARPSYMLRPKLYRDGNKWCALYGKDTQEGVVGFGDSPELAFHAFDCAWVQQIDSDPKEATDESD